MRFIALVVFLALFAVAFADDDNVVVLTSKNFDENVGSGKWLIKFYAPWCGHCQRLAPTWSKASLEIPAEKAKFAKVDCTQENDLCGKFGVRGYPTLKYFEDGVPTEYQGGRDLKDFSSFIDKMSLPALTDIASADEMQKFTEGQESYVVFVGSDADRQLLIPVAKALRTDISFAYVSDASLVSAVKVEQSPAVVVVGKDFQEVYTGALESTTVTNWLKKARLGPLPELGPETFGPITESGLPVFIIVLKSSDKEGSASLLSGARDLAKNAKSAFLTYLDGEKWAQYVSNTYKIKASEYPAVAILDVANERYAKKVNTATAQDLQEVLSGLENNSLKWVSFRQQAEEKEEDKDEL